MSHGNELLNGRMLKTVEGGPLYGSPPDGPNLWPMLLYTSFALRGQVRAGAGLCLLVARHANGLYVSVVSQ